MTHVAPRIVNNVSFVSRINHEIHFSWQAQYLVSLDNDACCSAHCTLRLQYVLFSYYSLFRQYCLKVYIA